MRPDVRVDSTGFQRFTRELARRAGKLPDEILPLLAGRVLSTAVKYTKKASVTKAKEGARRRTERSYNTYAQGRSRKDGAADQMPHISITRNGVWWVDRNEKGERKFYKMDDPRRRWSDRRFNAFAGEEANRKNDLKAAIKIAEKAAKDARGLSAKTWVDIGRLLGVEVKAPSFVKKAKPSTQRDYDNAIALRGRMMGMSYIDIGTRMPIVVQKLKGNNILGRAVKATMTAYDGDVRRGVFDDAVRAAQRWPGIIVRR